MRTALLVSAASAFLAALSHTSYAAECTSNQRLVFYTDELFMCTSQIYEFQVCDDACLDMLRKLRDAVPDCVDTISTDDTLADNAVRYVTDCTKRYSDKDKKYVPRAVPGLPICTKAQRDLWHDKHGLMSPASDCRKFYSGQDDYCNATCKEKLQKAVLESPPCTQKHDNDFWIGEREKKWLQWCLLSRKDNVFSDRAMRTLPTTDGKLEEVEISSSPSKTTGSVTTTTTNTPTTTVPSTSSAAAAAVSALAIGGSVIMTLLL